MQTNKTGLSNLGAIAELVKGGQRENICEIFGRRLYINLTCLFVCMYPINVKTAEPIGPKFCV